MNECNNLVKANAKLTIKTTNLRLRNQITLKIERKSFKT